jgi:hypothetical protein
MFEILTTIQKILKNHLASNLVKVVDLGMIKERSINDHINDINNSAMRNSFFKVGSRSRDFLSNILSKAFRLLLAMVVVGALVMGEDQYTASASFGGPNFVYLGLLSFISIFKECCETL